MIYGVQSEHIVFDVYDSPTLSLTSEEITGHEYAHMITLYVKKGDRVAAYTPIGKVSGNHKWYNHIHMEVDTDTKYPFYTVGFKESASRLLIASGATDKTLLDPLDVLVVGNEQTAMEMNWVQFLNEILQTVVVPLIGILTVWFVKLISQKMTTLAEENKSDVMAKYILMLKETVVDCVEATNQTFVDAIKASGEFTPEAQKAAFEKTLHAVTDILSEDAKAYLTEACGDLDAYITALIEATVKRVKSGAVA